MIREQISLPELGFLSESDKAFILAFTDDLMKLGYREDGFQDGFCWGRYMIVYRKAFVKSPSVCARIYIRADSVCLRLFLRDVTKRADAIENAPDFIRSVFTGDFGKCKHCKGDKCRFQKAYTLGGVRYEKCNGLTFQFEAPSVERLGAYIDLFRAFYAGKKGAA